MLQQVVPNVDSYTTTNNNKGKMFSEFLTTYKFAKKTKRLKNYTLFVDI